MIFTKVNIYLRREARRFWSTNMDRYCSNVLQARPYGPSVGNRKLNIFFLFLKSHGRCFGIFLGNIIGS